MTFCACGQPVHYTNPTTQAWVERQIAKYGDDVIVRCANRIWFVQRHYAALHGVRAADLPDLKFPELLRDDTLYLPFKHDVGGIIIDHNTRDYTNQIFSHRDLDGRHRHFHIPKLARIISEQTPDQFSLDALEVNDKQAAFITENHNIDPTHIAERISDEVLNTPGIICVFANGTQLIVDGNHRFVGRAQRGLPFMQFWMLPEESWAAGLLAMPASLESL